MKNPETEQVPVGNSRAVIFEETTLHTIIESFRESVYIYEQYSYSEKGIGINSGKEPNNRFD